MVRIYFLWILSINQNFRTLHWFLLIKHCSRDLYNHYNIIETKFVSFFQVQFSKIWNLFCLSLIPALQVRVIFIFCNNFADTLNYNFTISKFSSIFFFLSKKKNSFIFMKLFCIFFRTKKKLQKVVYITLNRTLLIHHNFCINTYIRWVNTIFFFTQY